MAVRLFGLFDAENHVSRRGRLDLACICGDVAFYAEIPSCRDFGACGTFDRRACRKRSTKAFVSARTSLLVRSDRADAHFSAAGLFVPVRAYACLRDCRHGAYGGRSAVRLCGDSACGVDRRVTAVFVRSFFHRCAGVNGAWLCHRHTRLEIRQQTA